MVKFRCNLLTALRRFLVAAALGLWLGGFTFYSAVVIHVGTDVLGDHRQVGFISERVSNWLNLIGAVALVLALWNMVAIWRTAARWRQAILGATWLVMTISLAALVVLHRSLDGVLNTDSQEIVNYDEFLWLHGAYLAVSTVQWGAGLLHVFCLVFPSRAPMADHHALNAGD
ncbi:MAG TPA: hypothetical protein VGH32_13650 [Pirellulales bacterium]